MMGVSNSSKSSGHCAVEANLEGPQTLRAFPFVAQFWSRDNYENTAYSPCCRQTATSCGMNVIAAKQLVCPVYVAVTFLILAGRFAIGCICLPKLTIPKDRGINFFRNFPLLTREYTCQSQTDLPPIQPTVGLLRAANHLCAPPCPLWLNDLGAH